MYQHILSKFIKFTSIFPDKLFIQDVREQVTSDGSIERCENTGFETVQRTECNNVPETVCETVDRVKYRTEIVPQCR